MESSLYKDFTTSRGLVYHYYAVQAQGDKPTLLFCHGFPSTSWDWRHIAPYFKQRGYGVIVPDLLGYGGTSKPTDPATYRHSLICKDVVEILDAEGIRRAVAIGHDWGSRIVSRLANYFPDRFIAYAFFAVPFNPPHAFSNVNQILAFTKQQFGYELIGYWLFFSEEGAESIIRAHWDSFMSVLYPHHPAIWRTNMAPTGALKASLMSNFKAPLPSYITEEERQRVTDLLLGGGMEGPLCWYKVITSGLSGEDDKAIPHAQSYPPASSPLFYGAAAHDAVALAASGKNLFTGEPFKNHNVTIQDYDADHWVILSHANKVNQDLEAWLDNVVIPVCKARL